MTPVRALFSIDLGKDFSEPLERFLGERLHQAGVWRSPGESDGIDTIRVREQTPDRLRACGRIWTTDQTIHDFWVDLDGRGTEDAVTWHLYFDIEPNSLSPRRLRNAIDIFQDPSELSWQVELTGTTE